MNTTFYRVYWDARAKYIKLKFRLDKSISTGKFIGYSRKKQNQLIRKVEHLRRRVLQLHLQLKLAAAGVTLSLFLNSTPAQAQTTLGPFVRNYPDNPFRPPLPDINKPAPIYVDLDGDGDKDLVIGSRYNLRYYKNIGTKTKALFEEIDPYGDPNYPFPNVSNDISYPKTTFTPAFADIDGDGDLDLLVGTDEYNSFSGTYAGTTFYFKNAGTTTSPDFQLQTGPYVPDLSNPGNSTGNPFDGIQTERNAYPTFADLDGDGDMDLLLGGYYSSSTYDNLIQYFENQGTRTSPNYVNNNSSLADYYVVNDLTRNGSYSGHLNTAPVTFADLDEDGDLDFFITLKGQIIYYRNDAGVFKSEYDDPTQTGPWIPNTSSPGNSQGNPFDAINQNLPRDFNNYTSLAFVDLDNDGDLDVTIGYDVNGNYIDSRSFVYYENTGHGVLQRINGFDSPIDGIDISAYTPHSSFADIDGDGDLDVLLSGTNEVTRCPDNCYYYNYSYLLVFENNGGKYVDITNTAKDKLSALTFADGGIPQLDDVNGDGLPDLVVPYVFEPDASSVGKVQYFENVAGSYVERTGADNPFDFISVPGEKVSVDLGDLDGDGKPDLLLNTGDAQVQPFQNTGTPTKPQFTSKPEWKPTDATGYVYGYHLTLLDLDHDGDLDIILGKYDQVWYYENIGTKTSPSFSNHYGEDEKNPFKEFSIRQGSPGVDDIDGDGDLDLIAGNYFGQFEYYENKNPAALTQINSSPLTYGSQPVFVDETLVVSDADNDLIVKATVKIINYNAAEDLLTVSTQSPVIANFDTSTGILTLTGASTVALYQSILRTVKYEYKGTGTGGRKGGKTKGNTKQLDFQVFDSDLTTSPPSSRTITVPSNNKPPVIASSNLVTAIGNKVSLVLEGIISDPDGNLDPSSFQIVPNVSPTAPTIGNATILDGTLTVDYTGNSFTGKDVVTIEACDLNKSCSTAEITIQVTGSIIVYDGVSANGDGKNDFLKIEYISLLSPQNKVSIFNRWGDKVFQVSDYDNDSRKFEGKNDQGNTLPNGIYFYVIELTNGQSKVTGYLTLK